MILNETMNEIADAIREKTGKTELIAPVNFAEEIKSISAGGGDNREYEYFDFSAFIAVGELGTDGSVLLMAAMMAMDEINVSMGKIKTICSPAMLVFFGDVSATEGYFSLRVNAPIVGMKESSPEKTYTFKDFLKEVAEEKPELYAFWESLPRITKEEFYTL